MVDEITRIKQIINKDMIVKENLANQYDGPESNENFSTNNVSYLVNEFNKVDLENKKDLEEYRELLIHARKTVIGGFEGFVQRFLNEYIGEGRGCRFSHGWNRARLSIGLKAFTTERVEKGYFFEFGHKFEITWDKEDSNGELQMSYGTLGGFDLENGEGRLKYLHGMAEFANNKEWINKLKERFIDANAKLMEIGQNIDEINEKLKNPKID